MPAMLKHRADKNKMQKHTAVTSPAAIDPTFIPRVCNRRLLSERKQDRGRVEMLCDALFLVTYCSAFWCPYCRCLLSFPPRMCGGVDVTLIAVSYVRVTIDESDVMKAIVDVINRNLTLFVVVMSSKTEAFSYCGSCTR